jgi:hypothetical protein
MHRAQFLIAVAFLVAGCDPVVSSRLRLTPSPEAAVDSTTARRRNEYTDALAAVERLALHSGLDSEPADPGCTRSWRNEPIGYSIRRLYLCVSVPADSGFAVDLWEFISDRWSPKGDSLRRALADTLARSVPSTVNDPSRTT